jgi:hypothetical protein
MIIVPPRWVHKYQFRSVLLRPPGYYRVTQTHAAACKLIQGCMDEGTPITCFPIACVVQGAENLLPTIRTSERFWHGHLPAI